MREQGNGSDKATAVHHSHSRRVKIAGFSGSTVEQKQVGNNRNVDFREIPSDARRGEASLGGILRGLITNARDQIKLLEGQIELWESQLNNLETSELETSESQTSEE
jgi:hypothetical protein